MKKLMIAAAIVCAAAMSQAASLQWGGAIADADYNTSGGAQAYPATAVLVLADAGGFVGSATKITGLTIGSTTDNKGTVIDTFSIGQAESEAWEFEKTWENVGKDVNGSYAVLVTDGDGKFASWYTFDVSGTTAASALTDKALNPGWGEGNDFLEMGGYTVQVSAVPEPTSGLLLLLGVAGLALRRRRA